MPSDVKLYRVLLASPGDVAEEREIVRKEIERWNSMHSESTKIILQSVGWETDATPNSQERGQAVINRQLVDPADLLIGIFWTRLGTPTPEADSGTVEEIERFISEGKRCIIYFSDRQQSPSEIDQRQFKRLQKYKKELQTRLLASTFQNLSDLKEQVSRHITSAIQEIGKQDRERLAAAQEARITEQLLGLVRPQNRVPSSSELSFSTLLDTQISVKQILESKFSLQDMEDIKEQEIANIQAALASPELAMLFSNGCPTTETISTIAQIIEAVTLPSLYIIDSVCKYGDDSSTEWLDFVGDWVERLSTQKDKSGYEWASSIRLYPALLLLYASGISSLRSARINFIKEVTERWVNSASHDVDRNLLERLDPRIVFDRDIGQLIEASAERRFTPVSNYLTKFIQDNLYCKTEYSVYVEWFDLFEFLLSLKSVQLGNRYLYEGAFVWRTDGRRKLIQIFQDALLGSGRHGVAVQKFLDGGKTLVELADAYDKAASDDPYAFGRAGRPSYLGVLVKSVKSGQRIRNFSELNQLLRAR
jgi:nucleoside 2-deoxyribosyltransferase